MAELQEPAHKPDDNDNTYTGSLGGWAVVIILAVLLAVLLRLGPCAPHKPNGPVPAVVATTVAAPTGPVGPTLPAGSVTPIATQVQEDTPTATPNLPNTGTGGLICPR